MKRSHTPALRHPAKHSPTVRSRALRGLMFGVAVALLQAMPSAQAAGTNITWTGNDGTTNFEDPLNWTGNAVPANDTTTNVAVFSGTPTTNEPALSQSRSINGLLFSTTTGGWTLSGSAYTLTVGGSGISTAGQTSGMDTVSANINLGAKQTFTVGAGGTLLVSGVVSGTYQLLTAGNTTGNLILSGTNTYTNNTVLGVGIVTATNTQAFGNPTTNPANEILFNNGNNSTLNLYNDGATPGTSGQTIIYGGPAASSTGYNLTGGGGNINVGNLSNPGSGASGNAGSINNTIQLGTFTYSAGATLAVTGANGYGLNFNGGITGSGASVLTTGTTTGTTAANAVAVSATGLAVGTSFTETGTGSLTVNGTLSGGTASTNSLIVGGSVTINGTATALPGNVILKGTGSTFAGNAQLATSGSSLTLYNSDSLGSGATINLNGGSNVLNLRNDADTSYGNAIASNTGSNVINVDQATAGHSGHTMTLGTLNTSQTTTFTNGNGDNLALGAASTSGNIGFTNNMVNGTLTVASLTSTGGGHLTFNGTSSSAATTVSGVISTSSGTADVRQSGSGTLILQGQNTYTGGTTVSVGTLLVNNTAGSGTGSGAVTLSGTGSVLGGTGTINAGANAITIGGAGSIITGGTVGTVGMLTLTTSSMGASSGGVYLNGSASNPAVYDVDITSAGTDKLAINGFLDLAGANDGITLNNISALAPGTYQLATYSSISGTFNTVSGLASNESLVYNTNGTELDLVVAAVPEPATVVQAGMMLAIALGAAGWRRIHRRRAVGC